MLKYIINLQVKSVDMLDDVSILYIDKYYKHNEYDIPLLFKGNIEDESEAKPGEFYIKINDDGGSELIINTPSDYDDGGQLIDTSSSKDIFDLVDQYPELSNDYISSLGSLGDNPEVYAPMLVEDDNILAKLLKTALQNKKAPFKIYENRFQSATDRGNHKKSLESGKLSINRFLSLCDKLDIDIEIKLTDRGGNIQFPMDTEIIERC